MAALDNQAELRVTVAQLAPSAHVASVSGELDLYNASDLRDRLYPLADGGRPEHVIADLGGVTFLDSTALGVLTGLAKRLRTHGGELVVVTPDPRLRRLLEITGLSGVLHLERTLTEAVEGVVGDIDV